MFISPHPLQKKSPSKPEKKIREKNPPPKYFLKLAYKSNEIFLISEAGYAILRIRPIRRLWISNCTNSSYNSTE